LPLAFLLLRSRVQRLRRLGLASILPSLANVNEPLIFGIPIVMNPGLVIPFISIPLVLAVITYVVESYGLVNRTAVWLPGAIPSFIAAWVSTKGDWRAEALIVFNSALAFALWIPFFRSFERTIQQRPEAEEELVKTAAEIQEHLHAEQHAVAPGPHRGA